MLFVGSIREKNMIVQFNCRQMKKNFVSLAFATFVIIGVLYFVFTTQQNSSSPRNSFLESSSKEEVRGPGRESIIPISSDGASAGQIDEARTDTLYLNDFGVVGSGEDETEGFQKAIDAAIGKVLYIPQQQGSFYLVGQLIVPSNSDIVFNPKSIVQASNDLKTKINDFEVLFRIQDVNNVSIKANDALFKMNKLAYDGEHNHIFMINGANNVLIDRARANDSGGDGYYIGAYRTRKAYSENIRLINCSASNNRRQGLSIISAKNVLVENGVFDRSSGASPETGVDIEPSRVTDVLQKIRIRNCTASDNKRRGFLVILNKLNATSEPVDIVFENCVANGNLEGFSTRQAREVQGTIEFNECTAKESRVTGFTESSCLANSVRKIYKNCIAENSNTSNRKMDGYKFKASYYLSGSAKNRQIIGNSQFINCTSVVNGESNTVDYGIVIDNGDHDVAKITLDGFKASGKHNHDRVFIQERFQKSILGL